MISCQPTGIFSWNYQITLEHGGEAALEFAKFRDQAEIRLQGQAYQVVKDGFMSPRWQLLQDNDPLATAQKPNLFLRRFEITSDRLSFALNAAGVLTRTFEFVLDSRTIGTITPDHVFTRRACIECDSRIPVLLQLFSLSLAVFAWRRAARSSSQ